MMTTTSTTLTRDLFPVELVYLRDSLFELQTVADAQRWPERFLDATPVGADLSGVWSQWAVWMLTDPDHGMVRYAEGLQGPLARVANLLKTSGIPKEFLAAARAATRSARLRKGGEIRKWVAITLIRTAWVGAGAPESVRVVVGAAAETAADKEQWARAACDKLIDLLRASSTTRGTK